MLQKYIFPLTPPNFLHYFNVKGLYCNFYDGLIQSLCSPLTETSALNRFYTIAHRYDNIKVIELHFFALVFSCHSTMLSGLSEFPNNHFFIKFSLFKNI